MVAIKFTLGSKFKLSQEVQDQWAMISISPDTTFLKLADVKIHNIYNKETLERE